MRRTFSSRGSFVLNSVLRPDWKQWFSRQDRHVAGRDRVEELRGANPRSMDLGEANKLVELFTTHHNFEDLSFVIKYIRENLRQELQPLHYDSLMRLFNFSRDKDNFEQMLEVVTLRDKDDMDTYARVMDQIHAAGSPDGLRLMLEIIGLAEGAFDSLVGVRISSGEFESRRVVGGEHYSRDDDIMSAPLLSSLMHHSCMMSYSLVLPLLVLAWRSALGASYDDWDFANLLSVLLARADEFNELVSVIGVFDDCETGFVSFDALRQRLEDRSLLVGESSPLAQVIQAMQKSLEHHRIPLDTKFRAPFFNLRTCSVDSFVRIVLSTSCVTPGANAAAVYHTTVLLLSTLHNNAEALETAREAIGLFKRYDSSEDEAAGQDDSRSEFRLNSDFAVDLAPVLEAVSYRSHRLFTNDYADVVKLLEPDLNDSDLEKCSSIAITFLSTEGQVRDILVQATELLQQKGHLNWAARNLVKHILRWCAAHPPRNVKMSSAVLAEREKWATYIAARDTALALFGSGGQARDAMKILFYNKLKLATVRDESSISADLASCSAALNVSLDHATSTLLSATATSIGGSSLVPRHLHDPNVENPYPHIALHPMDSSEAYQPAVDIFPEVFAEMKKAKDREWYYRDTEVYVLLMRCLIHRLDWDASVDLTLKLVETASYTALIDQELIGYFAEMGDPMGLLALKIVTKIYDGRIHVDAKSKRDRFQEQMI